MRHHHLKIREEYYEGLSNGKGCEIRLNDRDYQKGDTIGFDVIRKDSSQPQPAEWTFDRFRITHVLHFPEGLREGYVALSIKKIKP